MRGTIARSVLVLVAVTVLGGACSSSNTPSGSKAGYIAKVELVCAEMHEKVGTLGNDPEKEATAVNDGYMKIKDIKAPNEDLEKLQVFVESLNNLQLALQDVDQSRRVNDQARAQRALANAKDLANKAAKAAKDYGFTGVCSRSL